MPKLKTLTLAMSAVSMMAGCASSQPPVGESGLRIKPVQTVSHGNGSPQAFYQLGRYYHGQTRYEQALEAYGQAVSLQPQYVEALTGMGVAHAMLGHYDEALRVLKAAASIDPASVTAQNNLGYIYWLLNEREKALEAYRAALTIDPTNARARDNLDVAMNGRADAPAAVAATAQSAAAPEEAVEASSNTALRKVAPQVYELRAPAPSALAKTEAGAAQAPAASAVSDVATAEKEQGATGSTLALDEVAPRVYELRASEQKAEHSAQSAEPAPAASAAKVLVADAADSASTAATGRSAHVEVMNGNGVKGLANSVTRYLAAQGYPTLGAGNQPHFNETRTRIEYRPGYAGEAGRLSGLLPDGAELSEVAAMDGQASLRLVLGKDLRRAPDAWKPAGQAVAAAGTAAVATTLAVANGNGVKGMARQVAGYLAERGYRTTSVYDMRPFNKTVTRIEYRTGHEADAIRVGAQLPGKVAYLESPRLHTKVRLVLGHDIKSMAAWSPEFKGVKLAQADAAGGH